MCINTEGGKVTAVFDLYGFAWKGADTMEVGSSNMDITLLLVNSSEAVALLEGATKKNITLIAVAV